MFEQNEGVGRREFLRAAGLGLGCLAVGLREALAQAKKSGKPVLTESSLNALVPKTMPKGKALQAYKSMLGEAQRDPKGFVRKRFSLTPAQEQALKALPASEEAKIKRALATAHAEAHRVNVKFTKAPRVTRLKADDKAPPPNVTVEVDIEKTSGGYKGGVKVSWPC